MMLASLNNKNANENANEKAARCMSGGLVYRSHLLFSMRFSDSMPGYCFCNSAYRAARGLQARICPDSKRAPEYSDALKRKAARTNPSGVVL